MCTVRGAGAAPVSGRGRCGGGAPRSAAAPLRPAGAAGAGRRARLPAAGAGVPVPIPFPIPFPIPVPTPEPAHVPARGAARLPAPPRGAEHGAAPGAAAGRAAAAARRPPQQEEVYLEKWSPQSALGQLQAKLDASEAESEAQIKQFLAQDLPLESFLESFCQSRTRSHICRTQLEKLQELLQKEQAQKDQSGVAPKAFDLSYGFVPAFLIPSEAVAPFPVPAAPPKHHLPALGQQPASPCSEKPSLGSPLRLVGHIPVLSPPAGRGQQQQQQQEQEQEQEPPHR
ncbi:vacuolar protein sorting-associated protein 37D isoform X2 [Taeniopygia guttata]|uniref:vacuolar protein sorting-associated protein 37D isoform X2 n=1 Tax=Taeniopygia guttata TaxID=59729 RepID=UPI003BB889FE